jgi:hypothetical protein
MNKRLLVIFGLRGCILDRALFRDALPAGAPPPHFVAGAGRLWMRPRALQVMEHLSSYCDLAIWSATAARNTHSMTDAVFKDFKVPLRFVWSRDMTVPDDCRRQMTASREDLHATMKDLHAVKDRLPPEFPIGRIVLVDDTPSKLRCNSDNFVWVPPFDLQNWSDERPMIALRDFFDAHLKNVEDVRTVLPQRITFPTAK